MIASSVGMLNDLMGQYQTATGQIQSQSVLVGTDLFNSLALVSVGVWGVRRLLNRQQDLAESNIDLIRLFIYLSIFYFLITNYDSTLALIVSSFKAAAPTLGKNITNFQVVTNPGQVMGIGLNLFKAVLQQGAWHLVFGDLIGCGVTVLTAFVILLGFGGMAVEVLLIEVGSRIILLGGIMLLAFAATEWTRDYATKYINACFSIGLKMMFIYLIIGMSGTVTTTWLQTFNNYAPGDLWGADAGLILCTFVCWTLVTKLPDQAVGYLIGGHGINFGAHNSGLEAGAAVAGLAMQGYKVVGAKVAQYAAAQAGEKVAKETAQQFAKDTLSEGGKQPTDKDIDALATKTMGEARKEAKAEMQDSELSKTYEGRVALKVKAAMAKAQAAKDKDSKG